MLFEWDRAKAKVNIEKHGVSFEEASTVFGDPLSITILDPLHSDQEDRFVIIGVSRQFNMLVIAHVERNDSIRIISARNATSVERKNYEKGV